MAGSVVLLTGIQFLHITRSSPIKLTVCRRSSHPNYFQNHVPLLLTPTDRAGSCVHVFAILCRPGRTSLAIARVRRLLPCRSDKTYRTPCDDRSNYPEPVHILRAAFGVPNKPQSRRRVDCSYLFSLRYRLCILFANKCKSRVLRSLKQEAAFRKVSPGTQKGAISRFAIVIFTRRV